MNDFADRFRSTKQDWETPWDLFYSMDEYFHFTLDAAATVDNTKVIGSFFTEKENGLVQKWGHHIVWINPPYGDSKSPIVDWIHKAYKESLTGATSVLLIPARTNTNWFHDICLKYGEVIFIRGRPKFVGAKYGLPQPLCFVIFRPCIV